VSLLAELAERSYLARLEPGADFSEYKADPAGFAVDVLGSELTDGQAAILEAVRDHRIVLVQSANAVGKTYVGADLALWFGASFDRSKTIAAAAPPLENLEKLLWGEISARLSQAPELSAGARIGSLYVGWDGQPADRSQHWLSGRAIPNSAAAHEVEARFSGIHAPHLLFIVDEGDAVPGAVYRGIESCMSGAHDRLVVFYNPRYPSGFVWSLLRSGGAHVLQLDALTHPNVTSGANVIPGAVTRERVVERVSKWSRPLGIDEDPGSADSVFVVPEVLDGAQALKPNGQPWPALTAGETRKITNSALAYMVLARYPTQLSDMLIDRDWIAAARQRWRAWVGLHGDNRPAGRPRVGLDVAEMGDDLNAWIERWGSFVASPLTWSGVDVLVTGDRAAAEARRVDAEFIFVDANGVGAGVAPQVARRGVAQVVPIKTQQRPTKEPADLGAEFRIMRDQLYWVLREWLRLDPAAMLPDLDALEDQLSAMTYRIDNGKIRVVEKREIKALLGYSPDLADALALTFGDPGARDVLPMPGRPVASSPAGRANGERPQRQKRRRYGGLSGKF
jgi:hypothetical protein